MVPSAGLEPACFFKRCPLKTVCLPIPPRRQFIGRCSRARTDDLVSPRHARYQAALYTVCMVPKAGVEPAHLTARDSHSRKSTYSITWAKNCGRSTRIRTLDPLLPKQMRYRAALHSEIVVPPAGLEPARLAAVDFESTVSAIPPEGHLCMASVFKKHT